MKREILQVRGRAGELAQMRETPAQCVRVDRSENIHSIVKIIVMLRKRKLLVGLLGLVAIMSNESMLKY